jgi:hypothetical protein
MDEQVRGLSERVARLESFNRIHLVVSSFVVAAVVAVSQLPPIWADKDGPKSFSAQEFVLVDHSGRTSARLAAAPKGGAALTFYDKNDKRTIAIGFEDSGQGAAESVYDGNAFLTGSGIERAGLGVGGQGIGWAIRHPNGTTVLNGSTGLDGSGPFIFSADPNGNFRTFEGVVSPTEVGFFATDSNGNTRTGVEVDTGRNFDGMFTSAANGTLQSLSGGANDDTAAYDILYDGAGTLEALKYVKADGSFSGDDAFDVNGTLRVESYQDPTQTPVQGVQVFDASSNSCRPPAVKES